MPLNEGGDLGLEIANFSHGLSYLRVTEVSSSQNINLSCVSNRDTEGQQLVNGSRWNSVSRNSARINIVGELVHGAY